MHDAKKIYILSFLILLFIFLAYFICADKERGTSKSRFPAVNAAVASPQDVRYFQYTDPSYPFTFRYSRGFSIEKSTVSPYLIDFNEDATDNGSIFIAAGSQNDESIRDLINTELQYSGGYLSTSTAKLASTTWNMVENDTIPQNGMGTAGSDTMYYMTRGTTTYVLECIDCSTDMFGDISAAANAQFKLLLSTFRFEE